jgi:hypothetical protein
LCFAKHRRAVAKSQTPSSVMSQRSAFSLFAWARVARHQSARAGNGSGTL